MFGREAVTWSRFRRSPLPSVRVRDTLAWPDTQSPFGRTRPRFVEVTARLAVVPMAKGSAEGRSALPAETLQDAHLIHDDCQRLLELSQWSVEDREGILFIELYVGCPDDLTTDTLPVVA